ncbi:MAG: adenylyltransferase/cytidyltransferase family protein [Deltaproteobacteria bacterium]|jgi:D-beta-D-heptose 7-phosphate kinase/D-beta-D-heptose 1-phosphate adenosyltransferase|nr:adenylyltransferase/cytidyltransferase family protein [Deltaproteobacteria bacterium]MBW2498431.1 adenylyltransferase/cytidyltransferase family protein [Deltaproteobacteria bacterium]
MKAVPARTKISSLRELARRVARARRAGERIVFTNGCFDLLHVGHVRCLEEASRLGDRLIVAIDRDADVRAAKGAARPILPLRERMEIVASLGCVDWVVAFGGGSPIRLIRTLEPDVLVKGEDWPLEAIVGREEVEARGGRVVRLQVVPGRRSTRLIEAIRRGRRD